MGVITDDAGNQSAQIRLKWTKNAELDLGYYRIEWSRDNDHWESMQVDRSGTACFVNGLDLGGTYWFRMKAVDESGNESAFMDFASGNAITMPSDTTGPDACTGLTTYSRHKAVHLEWTNPAQKDFARVQVWRSAGAGGPGTQIATVDGDNYTDEIGLWDSTWYYNVRSVDNTGNAGGYATWTVGSTDITAPTGPSTIKTSTGAAVDADGHIIPWVKASVGTASSSEDVKYHEVEYQWQVNGTWWEPQTVRATGTAAAGSVSARVAPAPGNVSYRMRARAVDDANLTSTWTSYGTGTTAKDNVAPSTPTCSATGVHGGIRIETTEPSEDDWALIKFYADTSSLAASPTDEYLVSSGRKIRYTHDTGTDYTEWYARCQVVDSSGNASSFSNQAAAAPVQQASADVGSNEISNTHVSDGGLNDIKILMNGTLNLSDWSVTGGYMNADYIQAGTIDASVVTVTNLVADNIASGTIDASSITVVNLNADNVTTGTLTCNAGVLTFTDVTLTDTTFGEIKVLTIGGGLIVEGPFSNQSESYFIDTATYKMDATDVLTSGTLKNVTIASGVGGGGGLNVDKVDGIDCTGTAKISGWGQGTFTVMLAA